MFGLDSVVYFLVMIGVMVPAIEATICTICRTVAGEPSKCFFSALVT